jgi:hypothetical protein
MTFNNSAYLYNNGTGLVVSGSTLNFNSNAYFKSNSTTQIETNSQFVMGDGSTASTANFTFNGPSASLQLYDNSTITIKNKNNYYFNWGAFNYYPTTASASTGSYSVSSGSTQSGCALLSSAGITTCVVLPVLLSDFTALSGSSEVDLSWDAMQETNFDHFDVQRSADGEQWTTIGNVEAKEADDRNSAYNYADHAPLQGTSYYRLQMVDLDGQRSCSKIITVQGPSSRDTGVSIFPNPVTNLTFNLKLPSTGQALLKIYSLEGRQLYSASYVGQYQYQVRLPASLSGNSILIVQVIHNGSTIAFDVLNQ